MGELDKDKRWVRALDGTEYMPGLVGLNNMKANDYVNAIVQARLKMQRCAALVQHIQPCTCTGGPCNAGTDLDVIQMTLSPLN